MTELMKLLKLLRLRKWLTHLTVGDAKEVHPEPYRGPGPVSKEYLKHLTGVNQLG